MVDHSLGVVVSRQHLAELIGLGEGRRVEG